MEKLSIAMVQMDSAIGEIDNNLSKIKSYIDRAAENEVDFICFPELSITGYSSEKSPEYAETIPGSSSLTILQWAQEKQIVVIAGICEKNNKKKPFITQVACLPDGTINKYRKTHLAPHEISSFSSGRDFPVFHAPKAQFGIEICWELHFPDITSILSLQGAEIIFCPYASARTPKDRQMSWHIFLPARAYDNRVFISSCNAVSKDFGGGILICDPEGNIIVEDYQGKDSMVIAQLKPDIINSIRHQENQQLFQSFYPKYRKNEIFERYYKK